MADIVPICHSIPNVWRNTVTSGRPDCDQSIVLIYLYLGTISSLVPLLSFL